MHSIPEFFKNSRILVCPVPYFTTLVGSILIPDNDVRQSMPAYELLKKLTNFFATFDEAPHHFGGEGWWESLLALENG